MSRRIRTFLTLGVSPVVLLALVLPVTTFDHQAPAGAMPAFEDDRDDGECCGESAAIGTLRTLRTVQAQFQQAIVIDEPAGGIVEYGLFEELSGAGEGVQEIGISPQTGSKSTRNCQPGRARREGCENCEKHNTCNDNDLHHCE